MISSRCRPLRCGHGCIMRIYLNWDVLLKYSWYSDCFYIFRRFLFYSHSTLSLYPPTLSTSLYSLPVLGKSLFDLQDPWAFYVINAIKAKVRLLIFAYISYIHFFIGDDWLAFAGTTLIIITLFLELLIYNVFESIFNYRELFM